ncbi:MAG: inosine/xanthosine triphosphatase [Dehalococcoidia bacterium]|nr:inosine/xanthosine triphosphatase [Dehalococcoidia bacterium]
MLQVIVGSTNSGKVDAVRRAFARSFGDVKVVEREVASGVAAQPVGEECFSGARNRACAARDVAKNESLHADFCVGIEGGLLKLHGTWFGLSVVCILSGDGPVSFGTSPLFEMPEPIVDEVLEGKELGDIMIELSGDADIRERLGAVGYLTHGLLTREEAHEAAVVVALAPHLSRDVYER